MPRREAHVPEVLECRSRVAANGPELAHVVEVPLVVLLERHEVAAIGLARRRLPVRHARGRILPVGRADTPKVVELEAGRLESDLGAVEPVSAGSLLEEQVARRSVE